MAVAGLAAATDLLVRYLKRERIPAVVRRPIPALGGVSLMHLLDRGDTRKLQGACRDMFRFDRVHSPVILGEDDDAALLGVVTLEILGLVLHPFNRTLQPMRMTHARIPAANA